MGWTPQRFWSATEHELRLAANARLSQREDNIFIQMVAATHIATPIVPIAKYIGVKGFSDDWNDPTRLVNMFTGKSKPAKKIIAQKTLPRHLNIKALRSWLNHYRNVLKKAGPLTLNDSDGNKIDVEERIKQIESGALDKEIEQWHSEQRGS